MHNLRSRVISVLVLLPFIALFTPTFAAQHSTDNQDPLPTASSGTDSHTEHLDLTDDLTIGKSPNENIATRPKISALRKASDAAKKLGKIREIRGSTNQWEEVARLLQEIKNSDTGSKIKTDVRRLALIELAGLAEGNNRPTQALDFLAEYVERYPEDEIIPEILLRQAYVYRSMGTLNMAISKLYLVMTAALKIKSDNLEYFERVVLTAQTEIAETYFMDRKYEEAAEMYSRLLNDPDDELNVEVVRAKLIRSLSRSDDHATVEREARQFLQDHAVSKYQAEVRYLLALAHKGLGEKQEALRELLLLLEAVEVAPADLASQWKSWKMAAGNEIGNQLFLEGDYTHAEQVYRGLVNLDEAPEWRLALQYQIGLCLERNLQPEKAIEAYDQLIKFAETHEPDLAYNLKMVVSMARFRHAIITWTESIRQGSGSADSAVIDESS